MSEHSANFETASDSNKELALAKYDFIELAKKSMKELEPVRGKTGALKSFLHHFNNHLLGEEVKVKLRRKKIHQATFYRWLQAYEKYGLDGLLERHHGSGLRIDKEVKKCIESLACQKVEIRYRDIFKDLPLLLSHKSEEIHRTLERPCYSTVKDIAKRYHEEHFADIVSMLEGPRGLRDRHLEPVLGRMDEDLTRPNQRWEIDSTWSDSMMHILTGLKVKDGVFLTSDGKRCKVIGACDVYPRSLDFLLTERETGLAVGQLLKRCVLKWGIPDEVVIDNGRPFKNRRILGFLKNSRIAVHICIPGNPVEKPFIERAFRTLTEDVFRNLPGYTGNCVANRPNEIEVKYTMAELQRIIDRWVANEYDERVHGTTGQRPRERRNQPGFKPKTVEERTLDILLMEEYTGKVVKGCIRFNNARYFHESLPDGQKVKFKVDDSDASKLLVYYKGKHLCTALNLSLKGTTPQQIREAKKKKTREHKIWVKTNESVIQACKQTPTGLIARIDAAEKKKPRMLPRKGEEVKFPHLAETVKEETQAESELITSPEAKYMDIMRHKLRGEQLSEFDSKWLKRFTEDDHYKSIQSSLDDQLRDEMEAANA